ncbi:pentapeptide repeat-containing protein [Streptomyces xanthochromogenes]|uniref:pentapeptide repeat-containing protein n=1 Tax=Streptomyces xanthochromogenes TaxID=67384 RepID=UPI00342F9F27
MYRDPMCGTHTGSTHMCGTNMSGTNMSGTNMFRTDMSRTDMCGDPTLMGRAPLERAHMTRGGMGCAHTHRRCRLCRGGERGRDDDGSREHRGHRDTTGEVHPTMVPGTTGRADRPLGHAPPGRKHETGRGAEPPPPGPFGPTFTSAQVCYFRIDANNRAAAFRAAPVARRCSG